MKWILGIIVLVALAVGVLWWQGLLQPWIFPQEPVQETAQQPQPIQSQTGLPTADSDTSDDALVQDSAAIDAQIKAFESDSASVDESLNDKPVEQAY